MRQIKIHAIQKLDALPGRSKGLFFGALTEQITILHRIKDDTRVMTPGSRMRRWQIISEIISTRRKRKTIFLDNQTPLIRKGRFVFARFIGKRVILIVLRGIEAMTGPPAVAACPANLRV